MHNGKIIQTASQLTWILAEYLADTIAWLMRSILDHASKILFDNDTEPLLTPGFWILPLYRELLNSARRIRPSAASERARGCTGLVKLICKENKEQRGKRKFHEGEPHPNDRGGFTQWFGSCSLINTLYVWFPASWAPMVAERLFGLSSNPGTSSYPQHGQPASGLSQHQSGVHPWHQSRHEAAGSSGAMSDVDSTEVVYKIRQWSLPGAAVVPVLNVSSRVFWLELDDKAVLDSYTVLQEGILCDVFSQKCSAAAWQGAPGQRLTVAILLPGRQDADDWLNFMLSQKNLWPTFTTRGLSQRRFPNRPFARSGAGCRPSISGWRSSCAGTCWLTGCTQRPRLGSHVNNLMHCFSTRLQGAAKRIPMKKKPTVDLHLKQSRHGGNNAKIGCNTSRVKVHQWFWTCMDFFRLSGARKKVLVLR